jgi:hypothetical protein
MVTRDVIGQSEMSAVGPLTRTPEVSAITRYVPDRLDSIPNGRQALLAKRRLTRQPCASQTRPSLAFDATASSPGGAVVQGSHPLAPRVALAALGYAWASELNSPGL